MNRMISRYQYGTWLGMRNNRAECFIGNADGVFRTRESRRLEPQSRWDTDVISSSPVPISAQELSRPLSSNFGSPNVSAPDLERTGSRPSTWKEEIDGPQSLHNCHCSCKAFPESKFASRHLPRQWPLLRLRLQVLSKWLATSQPALPPWKQMQPRPQASTSWNTVGQFDGSTATRSHGPGSSGDNRNTRRRFDTSSYPDDEHARSAVILQFPCEQFHAGVSTWLDKLWATSNIPAFN